MNWEFREEGQPIGVDVEGPMYREDALYFCIEMHHGGVFRDDPNKVYIGGRINHFDYVDPDRLSLIELGEMAKCCGYTAMNHEFYFKLFEKELGVIFVGIKDDRDVLNLRNFLDSNHVVKIYFETNASNHYEVPVFTQASGVVDEVSFSALSQEEHSAELNTNNPPQIDVEEEEEEDEDDGYLTDGEDSVYDESFHDSDFDGDDDGEFNQFVDVDVEFGGVPSNETELAQEEEAHYDEDAGNMANIHENPEDSDDLRSACDSSDEEGGQKFRYPQWNPQTDINDPQFKLGMEFKTHREFRDAVKQHGIKNGKCIKFLKSDKDKVRAVCAGEGCPWLIYASIVKADKVYRIKTFVNECNCSKEFNVPWVTTQWVFRWYSERIRINPTWPVPSIVETIRNEWNVAASVHVVHKAKRKALRLAMGNEEEQYGLLWGYMEEVKKSNPGTTMHMKVESVDGSSNQCRFKRLYVCWGALKQGFMQGCRPLIGVDGCHLKSLHGGILLTAVGFDANNCIYPFAYAVVEQEKQNTWLWFLELLAKDLGIVNSHSYTFMSDRQKGLINAIEKLFPNATHRFCVRHMHNNFSNAKHQGPILKELCWKCARASNVPKFTQAMENMKKASPEAYEWLCKVPPSYWSRSHFSTYPKCDTLLNNLCESFNAVILQARDKPIITMLERIRLILMESVHRKRDAMKRHKGEICPKIQKILEKNKLAVGNWNPILNGGDQFELVGPYGELVKVDLGEKTCACRRWQLSGIPCVHVICAVYNRKMKLEDFVHNCYKKEVYLKTYDRLLNAINGKEMWSHTNAHEVLPPLVEKKPGRKQKGKRMEPEEPAPSATSLSRKGRKMTCSRCGAVGHNKTTCKANIANIADPCGQGEASNPTPTQGKKSKVQSMEASQIPTPTQPTGNKAQAGKGKKRNFQSRDASKISDSNNPVPHQYTQTTLTQITHASQVTQESNVQGVLACDMQESAVAATLSWRGRKILLASSSHAKASKQRKGGPRELA